jgi:hypothetical protein
MHAADPLESITAQRSADTAQGRARMAGPAESVLQVIQPVGLDPVIICNPTLRQALGT